MHLGDLIRGLVDRTGFVETRGKFLFTASVVIRYTCIPEFCSCNEVVGVETLVYVLVE